MKIFLAVDLNDEIKNKILKLQGDLKVNTAKGRWVSNDNFHITLKFFGEVEISKKDYISNNMELLVSDKKAFRIKFSKIGVFEKKNEIKVLWIGIDDYSEKLLDLKNKIDINMKKNGFEIENRVFKPHITLARDVKIREDSNFNKLKSEYAINSEMDINNITLFKSDFVNGKRIYTKIKKVSF